MADVKILAPFILKWEGKNRVYGFRWSWHEMAALSLERRLFSSAERDRDRDR